MWKCVLCGSATNLFCSQCLQTAYCGRKHQKIDWKRQHRQQCAKVFARYQNWNACHNVVNCGRYYDVDEHPDPEYCTHCGRKFPVGMCAHHGGCHCQIISVRWLTLFEHLLISKTKHANVLSRVDRSITRLTLNGSGMFPTIGMCNFS